jgi:phospho-N-acetylmuramoyl-pentapeptide-transferase
VSEFIIVCLVFILSALAMALSGGQLVKLLQKIGFVQFIRQEGPASHKVKSSTPTAGGLAFSWVILIVPLVSAIWSVWEHKLVNWPQVAAVAIFLLCSGAIGFWDDYLKKVQKQNEGLKPTQKLLCQILLSVAFALFLDRTWSNFLGFRIELGLPMFCIFVFLVIAGSLNAANLTDGLDGLAASVLGWSYLGLGTLIWLKGGQLSSVFWAFGLTGICFGFLRINGHPAKVFMGDTGSFMLGGGLACLALLEGLEWYLLVFMLVPILETFSVIMQVTSAKLSRRFLGRDVRPFKMTPFHHHLELTGWTEKKIVLWLASFQASFGIIFLIIYLLNNN